MFETRFHSGNWAGESKSSCAFVDDDAAPLEDMADCCCCRWRVGDKSEAVGNVPAGRASVFLTFSFLSEATWQNRQRHWPQRHKQRQSSTRNRQHSKPAHSSEGPTSLNSGLRNPFSPVPTNDITNPSAVVPSPA